MKPDALAAEEERLRSVYGSPTWDKWHTGYDKARVFFVQEQERALLDLLRRTGLSSLGDRRVLEVGCGNGRALRDLVRWGVKPGQVTGVDLLPARLHEARRDCAPGVRLLQANGARLPFRDAAFDVVMQFTVFTSILDEDVRRAVAGEMQRVLRPGGVIIWYDYFAPSPNPNVRAVRKRELRALFPGWTIEARRVTLAPPLARPLAERAWWLGALLGRVPLLRTHYLAAIHRP
jgi:ubiquinone/menaquinone biosynthesis C-methylase UbiE